MKIHIAYPATGQQKLIEIDDDRKLLALYDKRISHQVDGEQLDDDWKGYVFKISGGNDKQGFAMKQGVLTPNRVRLLLREGTSCYRSQRKGERKRRSVRGCIVSAELSVVNLIIVKKGEQEIEGLTDKPRPQRLGPKRASKIRKLFNLSKNVKKKSDVIEKEEKETGKKPHLYEFGDDVKGFAIRRTLTPKDGGKSYTKAPKIQRLITPLRLKRKRDWRREQRQRGIKARSAAKEYHDLFVKRQQETKDRKKNLAEERRRRTTSGPTSAAAQ